MSEPINDGGPAFPTPAGIQHNDGMTLRDYFAAAALQGIISDASVPASSKKDGELVSRSAYHFADSMLKARGAK